MDKLKDKLKAVIVLAVVDGDKDTFRGRCHARRPSAR
jgi:hypothetical protein